MTPAALTALLFATALSHAPPVDFVRDVRPILQRHCYGCHGEKKQKSGFRIDVRSAAFRGGELYGAGIVPGKPKDSPLIQFIADEDADLKMPPEGKRLTVAEIETLTRWVQEGAPWPATADRVQLKDPLDHWSFKPVASPPPPELPRDDWSRNEIDRFVLARLRDARLQPAVAADRLTWLRRVTFDLTGLPPTPDQTAGFLADRGPTAFERVVDRLLDSPRYGERWAQHWLDVVRYADTHGFEVNTERPHAWPYRDYVIRAFNDDVPYDQFIREQIVGDALGRDAATGFLVTASVLLPGQIGKDEPSKRLARQDSLDEIVTNIGQTFLGLSIGCARCHAHKFDPISQRDYYSMQAFVAGVEYRDRELVTPERLAARQQAAGWKQRIAELDAALARFTPLAGSGTTRPSINARKNIDRFAPLSADQLRFTIRATNNREPCIDELEVLGRDGRNVALASDRTTVKSSGNKVAPNRHELRFVNDGEYGNSRSWMSSEVGKGWVELTFAATREIDTVIWGRDRQGKFADRLATDYVIEARAGDGEWLVVADSTDRAKFDPNAAEPPKFTTQGLSDAEAKRAKALIAERAMWHEKLAAAENQQLVFAGTFREPDPIRLLTRGDPEQPKELVQPATLSALGAVPIPPDTPEQERRRALADWITSPTHPLTPRVMVNRIWQGHFGNGLVATPSDFGHSGQVPSHPKLLDWLAAEFIRAGWSMRRMHKLIVLSATYRQSSAVVNAAADKVDANARLLWRFPSRRLEAETIRDSMLAVSGSLNEEMYGRGFDLFDKRGGLTGFKPVERFRGDGLRRMIYAHKVRRERDAVFGAFDCPDAGQSTARRRESTTPIQALNLFNSRFTLDQSAAFAGRVLAEAGDDVTRQVTRAFELALNRSPSVDELADAAPVVRTHGLPTLCRVLFNSNEFLFLP